MFGHPYTPGYCGITVEQLWYLPCLRRWLANVSMMRECPYLNDEAANNNGPG